MSISFVTLKNYLDAIANHAIGDIAASPHGVFWQTDYTTFSNGTISGIKCPRNSSTGVPVPILNKGNLTQSAFYLILVQSAGFCAMVQMPKGGPWITDAGYKVTIGGTDVTGAQIQADILDWLQKGAPEF